MFRVDNSVFVWGAILSAGLRLRRGWPVALAGAGLLQLACDLPLHAGDGRAHFRPFTDRAFSSPLGDGDRAHGAGWIAPLEVALAGAGSVWLWLRFPVWRMRPLVAALMAAALSTGGLGSPVI